MYRNSVRMTNINKAVFSQRQKGFYLQLVALDFKGERQLIWIESMFEINALARK